MLYLIVAYIDIVLVRVYELQDDLRFIWSNDPCTLTIYRVSLLYHSTRRTSVTLQSTDQQRQTKNFIPEIQIMFLLWYTFYLPTR